jgi:hypothetical protein
MCTQLYCNVYTAEAAEERNKDRRKQDRKSTGSSETNWHTGHKTNWHTGHTTNWHTGHKNSDKFAALQVAAEPAGPSIKTGLIASGLFERASGERN